MIFCGTLRLGVFASGARGKVSRKVAKAQRNAMKGYEDLTIHIQE